MSDHSHVQAEFFGRPDAIHCLGVAAVSTIGVMLSQLDSSTIQGASRSVSIATAVEAIRWASSTYGDRCCLLTSLQDAVLVDLVAKTAPRVPIVFLDNGFQFAETLDMVRRVESRYGTEIEVVRTGRKHDRFVSCCDVKLELLETALDGRDAWITGIQRTATTNRATTEIIDIDRRGKIKISPLAQWSDDDRARYIDTHDVLTHPLLRSGYTSIGCEPCTTAAPDGGRTGRWPGSERSECGLHL